MEWNRGALRDLSSMGAGGDGGGKSMGVARVPLTANNSLRRNVNKQ